MTTILRFFAAIGTIFALYTLRAYMVLGGAFFGLLMIRVGFNLGREDGDWPMAVLLLVFGLWLLRVSFRWFAVRWHSDHDDDAPSA